MSSLATSFSTLASSMMSQSRSSIIFDENELGDPRIVELEEIIHTLMEENDQMKEQFSLNPTSSMDIIKQFDYFSTLMPLRGTQFLTGKIDTRMLKVQKQIQIKFSKPFADDPVVFVFKFSIDQSDRIDANPVTKEGFTVKFENIEEYSSIFWIAYVPIREKSDFTELKHKIDGTKACSQKDLEKAVNNYIKNRKNDINDEDANGNTLLHLLIGSDKTNLVDLVLSKGADVNALNKFRYSPLHTALAKGEINIEIVTKLLDKNPDLNIKNEDMRTPLHYLCRNQNLDKYLSILYTILNKVNNVNEYINEISKLGESALTLVCGKSMNEEAISELCEKGANVNQTQVNGVFPFYSAVTKKNMKIMQLLLQYGADIDKEYKGESVMKIAEKNGQLEGLINLIQYKYATKSMTVQEIEKAQNTFNSPKNPVETWTSNLTQSKIILVDQSKTPDYHIENFYTSCTHKHEVLMNQNYHDPTLPIPYYQNFIKNYPNASYAISKQDEKTNVKDKIVITIKQDPNDKKYIVWTKRDTIRKTAPPNTTDLQILKEYGFKGNKAVPLPQNEIVPQIVKFENYFIQYQYKFGVLYAKKGQTQESEFFNNKEGSPHFEKFLTLLGYKIELNGYQGFAGGLDTRHHLTGEYSYVNKFSLDKISIMYHIAPYLPWSDVNDQQLDKKRHIGNDVVVLIFKEYEGKPELLDISSFKTQFNHAFIVVGYDLNQDPSENPKYSVNIICKRDIPPIPPFITTDVYEHGGLFSDFLISKLINAEINSRESAQFRTKNVMIRQKLLEGMCEESK